MIDLTHLVYFLKKSRGLIAIGIVALIILLVVVTFRKEIIDAIFPPPPPPETVAFGILPPADLTEGIKSKQGVNFRLQTVTGNLPVLPKGAKVFAVAKKIPSFAAEQAIKNKADALRFDKDNSRVLGSVLEFNGLDNKQQTLAVDMLTGNFAVDSNLNASAIRKKPTNVEVLREVSERFFRVMGLDFNQFPKEKVVFKLLKFENNRIVEANALVNADMIEFDYNFSNLDKLPTALIRKGTSHVFAIIANDEVVYARKEIPNIELFRFATYPLKSVEKAWEELKSGQGYFNIDVGDSTINIKEVHLGYVITARIDQYLQPAYLFKGEGEFIAFIPAVSDSWILKETK